MLTDLEAGQFTDAFAAVDVNGLDSLEAIGKPHFDCLSTTDRTTGAVTEVGILGTPAQDATNAFDSVFTTGGAFELSEALLTPEIFELTTTAMQSKPPSPTATSHKPSQRSRTSPPATSAHCSTASNQSSMM